MFRVLLAKSLGYAAGLAFLAGPAFAACTESDLLADFAANDRDKLARIEAAAADVPNGEGLLWRVEAEGVAPSYLFGTIHSSENRFSRLPSAVEKAFDEAGTLAVEIADPASAIILFARPNLTMLPADTSLSELLGPEDAELAAQVLPRFGLPMSAAERMQPWFVNMVIAVPPCMLKDAQREVLDEKLIRMAKEKGMSLVGLETAEEQFSAFSDVGRDAHLVMLAEALRDGPAVAESLMGTVTRLYGEERMDLALALSREIADGRPSEAAHDALFERLIDVRNVTMAERATPLIAEGGAFVAVGALHLPGATGLVEQLRERGYAVTRVR